MPRDLWGSLQGHHCPNPDVPFLPGLREVWGLQKLWPSSQAPEPQSLLQHRPSRVTPDGDCVHCRLCQPCWGLQSLGDSHSLGCMALEQLRQSHLA